MFYSHEVLTSRKYGVATVWLVATLGSKSTLKKVSRKAILDVDVTKTCDTIITPEAPMALRLQSNLLYGVTRVYAQQCGYVLTDAENARNSLRAIFNIMRASELNAEGGSKARADQLILQDDPNFLPELDLLPIDLDNLEIATSQASQRSASILSPHSSQLTIAPLHEIGGLVVPQSASSFAGGPVGGLTGHSVRGDSGAGTKLGSGLFDRQEKFGLLDDDLGLVIGDDGNVFIEEDRPYRQPRGQSSRADDTGITTEPASARVRREHVNGEPVRTLFGQPDDDGFVMMPEDDFMIDQDAQAFPQQQREVDQGSTTSETAGAPIRRHRHVGLRVLSLDRATELHSSDLNRWSKEYIQNMNDVLHHKRNLRLTTVAKKNAEYWMLGASLEHLGQADRGPLALFTGAKLLEAFTGIKFTASGAKRARNEDSSSEDGRRVRSRGDPSSDEQGRDHPSNDDGFMPMMDDYDIEQGRDQPTPLDDRHLSSVFPWNPSAGSRRPTGLLSAGRNSVIPLGHLSRRGSRLTSASPLLGRGINNDLDDFQLLGSVTGAGLMGEEDFELFGPAAQVDTQTAAESQWVRTALDGESANFLTFVKAGIEELDLERDTAPLGDEEDEAMKGSIDFDYLLPTESNTHVVAAQALLHVLTLGTKNAIRVEQYDAFGPISLRLIAV